MAKVSMCIPVSSIESERVFSTAGKIVSKFRASLKSERVGHLIFIKENFDHQWNLCKEEIDD